jgi:hypothetical protein
MAIECNKTKTMNKDVEQFVDQLHGTASELKKRVIECETAILSKDEIYEFSRLLVSSAKVLTAAEKAFVMQERISYGCIGLAIVGFTLLLPFTYIGISLFFPSVPQVKQLSATVCEQTPQISKILCSQDATVKMRSPQLRRTINAPGGQEEH